MTSLLVSSLLGPPISFKQAQCKSGTSSRTIVMGSSTKPREDAGPSSIVDRRELLASMAGGASLVSAFPAGAAPIGTPNFDRCSTSTVEPDDKSMPTLRADCCPLAPKKNRILDFQPDVGPLRLRLPAHKLSAEYIDKYNLAYKKMRELDPNDPRNFRRQADVHCAYCNFSYRQAGDNKKSSRIQIHFGWFFFPWHRLYLHFHEKILGKLIGDPTFALPFWNWDNFDGATIPAYFQIKGTGLYDELRTGLTDPINLASANPIGPSTETDPNKIRLINRNTMSQEVARVTDQCTFLGGPVRKGDNATKRTSGGTVEMGSHSAGHVFAGRKDMPFGEDMGNFYSAGRDPLFYSHHSNVDRMWHLWRSLPGNTDFIDPDYLEAEFLFYDENADLVKCKVKDCLDLRNLNTAYVPMLEDEEWLNYTPPVANKVPVNPDYYEEISGETPVLKEPFSFKVTREAGVVPPGSDEILIIGVTVFTTETVSFNAYINDPFVNDTTSPDCAEFVGSFNGIPHVAAEQKPNPTRATNVRLSIRSNVEFLGLQDATALVVTLVPLRGFQKGFTVDSAAIKKGQGFCIE